MCPLLLGPPWPPSPPLLPAPNPFLVLPWMPTKSGQGKTSDRIDSADAIITLLREQIPASSQSQSSDEGWLILTVNVIYAFSAALGEGVGLVGTTVFLVRDLGSNICSLRYSHLRKSSLRASAFFFRFVSSMVALLRLFLTSKLSRPSKM